MCEKMSALTLSQRKIPLQKISLLVSPRPETLIFHKQWHRAVFVEEHATSSNTLEASELRANGLKMARDWHYSFHDGRL